jgi:phytoene dehydrogenase-like protein
MSRIGTPLRRATLGDDYDVMVVGSGIGGLTTAALLAKHGGKRVLVLERHYTAGGYTHVFRHGDYEWDVGVHYIGDVGNPRSDTRRLFDEISDGKLAWAPMGAVHDRVVIGDETYELPAGRDALCAELTRRFPAEERAIRRYIELVDQTAGASGGYFAEKAMPRLVSKVAGGFMRRKFAGAAARTTRDVLEELTDDPQLVAVLAGQFFTYGLPPAESSFGMHALVAAHYFEGGFYPVGGASRIAATILPVIERAGGAVITRAEVASILTESGRAVGVRLVDGTELRAPTIVSAAGVPITYGRLLPADLVSRHGLDRVAGRHHPSFAHVCLYVGLKHTSEELGLERTNYFVYPSADYERDFAAYAANPDGALPVVYLSFPAAKDPSFAERFPGRSTIDIMAPAPYELFAPWANQQWQHRGDAYEALKQRYAERLLEVLFRFVPQVAGKIDHCELSTPISTQHFMGYEHGEIYGMAATPERLCDRELRGRTPIPGLYLAGQDVAVLGVTGAMFGGLIAASSILGRDLGRVIRRKR